MRFRARPDTNAQRSCRFSSKSLWATGFVRERLSLDAARESLVKLDNLASAAQPLPPSHRSTSSRLRL